LGGDGFKWPYHDSYAPGLSVDQQDRVIIRQGLKKQYFPNEKGVFLKKDLKNRQKGIKEIEKQYVEKVMAT